jgi:hypothetical protein
VSAGKVEMTLPRVLGSRKVRHGGAVDEQARLQPARRVAAGSVGTGVADACALMGSASSQIFRLLRGLTFFWKTDNRLAVTLILSRAR